MPSSVISHFSLSSPDFDLIRSMSPDRAADSLRKLLSSLDSFEDAVDESQGRAYAIRGIAGRMAEERKIWVGEIDHEVDEPFRSFDRWLKVTAPKSWGYVRDAMRTVESLPDVKPEDLLQVRRCNLITLTKTSSHVRMLHSVIHAAKTQTESQFAETLTKKHGQHLEGRRTLKLNYSEGEMREVEEYLDWVGAKAGIENDRAAQLLYLAVNENQERQYERDLVRGKNDSAGG